MKKKELAIQIGVNPQTITGWCCEGRKPHKATAQKLVEFTGGYISMKDCGH